MRVVRARWCRTRCPAALAASAPATDVDASTGLAPLCARAGTPIEKDATAAANINVWRATRGIDGRTLGKRPW